MCLSSSKDKKFIDSKGIRTIFHEKMTQSGFSGKWNSYLGQIVIPNEFNNQCEFKFTTKFDKREYTMFIVKSDGTYFKSDENGEDNFITEDNSYNLRAKGTFVDPLRNIEIKNRFPEMPYHGYVEIRMKDYKDEIDEGKILRECLNSKFIGIYRYSEKVYDTNKNIEKIMRRKKLNQCIPSKLIKCLIIINKNGMILGYNQPLTENNKNTTNIYCYKVLSDECLDGSMGPVESFDREEPPSFIFAPAESFPPAGETVGNLRKN